MAGEFRIFWNIYLPLILPAAITNTGNHDVSAGVEQFYVAYDSFEFQGNDDDSGRAFHFPVSVQYNVRAMMAGTVIATIPTLLVFVFAQKYYIQGIAFSGGKE